MNSLKPKPFPVKLPDFRNAPEHFGLYRVPESGWVRKRGQNRRCTLVNTVAALALNFFYAQKRPDVVIPEPILRMAYWGIPAPEHWRHTVDAALQHDRAALAKIFDDHKTALRWTTECTPQRPLYGISGSAAACAERLYGG